MKALYRKYRPLKLTDVVGQEQVTGPLSGAIKAGKIGHAYLFIGPRGTGKTSVARIFAHEVNDFPYELEDDYTDIIEIDGASNRGIDNIRELREKVAIAPTRGKYKIYIIDEVHMLTKEAFNALLKTLEEPPKHVIFVMATTDAHKVPVTITSRAQVYNFKLAEPSVMLQHLKKICEAEGIKIDEAALEIVVKRGGGSYRDSLSLLDQISTLSSEMITKDVVMSAMGLTDEDVITKLLSRYKAGDLAGITESLKEIYSTGTEAKTLAEELMNAILMNPEPKLLPLLAKLPEVKTPYPEARLLVALTDNLSVASVHRPTSSTNQNSTPSEVVNNSSFKWEKFLEKVQSLNDAIYMQLKSVDFAVNGGTLDIYPTKKIIMTILSRDNNRKILMQAADGMAVKVHEPGENPNLKKDALISKMSDIMGGEVRNDTGGNPF
ncbi:DNA polymerase III subunit gamma/tau [Candidatus Saccharibacteria bacterium]|nr:DNA polymerase III subunit gamma/tau [Candidatus Saccharibacteria bacterium]